MSRGRKWLIAAGGLAVSAVALYAGVPFILRTADHEPPLNTVVISARLATSGQPSAAQLRRLRSQGYEAVINLAPPQSYGSISDEAEIVRLQGMVYRNLPVDWERPVAGDFAQFRSALNGMRGRRIWVHCQMNMRASVFTLLHRVIDEGVPVGQALGAVHAVWVPNSVWSGFIRDTLARHGVAFDPDDLR